MKTKLFLLTISLVLISTVSSLAQKKDAPVTFISGKISIAKYHEREELKRMKKGKLIALYTERIESIINILPSIAFATNANVTMEDNGIPKTKENIEAVNENKAASVSYFDTTIANQNTLLPYCDKGDLITAILFYETTLKSLRHYGE